jgi:signal transduction histidine kinase
VEYSRGLAKPTVMLVERKINASLLGVFAKRLFFFLPLRKIMKLPTFVTAWLSSPATTPQPKTELSPSRSPFNFRSSMLLLVLLILGYLGNYLNLELFLGVNFLFGSIATLTIVYLFGLIPGAIAAAIVSTYTYTLWSHPYAIIIFTLETVFVGWLLRRQRQSMVIADCIFWILIGIPLVWIFYQGVMGVPTSTTVLIMIKQAVNGIFNAVVANLIIIHTPIYKWLGRFQYRQSIPLQHMLLNLLVAFVFLPSLMLTVLSSQDALRDIETDIPEQLQLTSAYLTSYLNTWQEHQLDTLGIIQTADLSSVPTIESKLQIIHQDLHDSSRTYAIAPDGELLAAYPEPPTEIPFLEPTNTEQFQTLTLADTLLKIVPIGDRAQPAGYVINEAPRQSLNSFIFAGDEHSAALQVTLVDAEANILASTREELDLLQPFDHTATTTNRNLTAQVYHWLPTEGQMPLFARWKQSFYVQATPLQITPWQVIAEIPAAPHFEQLQTYYIQRLGLSLGIVVVAIAIAQWVSRLMVRPVTHLATVTTGLSERLLEQEQISWPQSTTTELQSLISNFKAMAGSLEQQFQTIKQANETLEQRITERTQELSESNTALAEKAIALEKILNELNQTQTKLVQAEKMSSLGQLVAGVAHEINNPVNFIHGNLVHTEEYAQNLIYLIDLYRARYPNPDADLQEECEEVDLDFLREDLPKIIASLKLGADRIRKIVLSLRNFSRVDEADFKAADINEGLESTLLILQYRLKAKPEAPAIKVLKNYGDLPLVDCYPSQLNQVFMNVLANAIDAIDEHNAHRTLAEMKAQPSEIQIHTALVDQDWIKVAIADNGPGIPEEVQKRIFEPFFTTKPIGKGTGMGMSISYQIITEQHGGKFLCHSQVGHGTEFEILIPTHQH